MNGTDKIADDVFGALAKMGGRATLWHISYEVRRNRRARGAAISGCIDLTVRGALEVRCGKSRQFRGVSDLFEFAEISESCIWSINHAEAARQRRISQHEQQAPAAG